MVIFIQGNTKMGNQMEKDSILGETMKEVVCRECEGRGRSPLEQVYKECPTCKGTRKILDR